MSLKHAILAALAARAQSGYDLGRKIDGSIGYFWTASLQQIYLELKALEKIRWVAHRDIEQSESRGKPDKKIYRLTPSGATELKRWIAAAVDEPGAGQPARDELLVRVFAGHLVPVETLLAVLEAARRPRVLRLRRFREIEREHFSRPERAPDKLQYQYLTLRRGIHYERAWLAWARETKSFLKRRARG